MILLPPVLWGAGPASPYALLDCSLESLHPTTPVGDLLANLCSAEIHPVSSVNSACRAGLSGVAVAGGRLGLPRLPQSLGCRSGVELHFMLLTFRDSDGAWHAAAGASKAQRRIRILPDLLRWPYFGAYGPIT